MDELRDVVFCEFCGGIEVSLAKCRATAAAAVFYERQLRIRALPALSPLQCRCAVRDTAQMCRPKE